MAFRENKPAVVANIQGLRAIAALLVVTMHAVSGQAMRHPGDALLNILRHATELGHAGVDIFFVISGFIICIVGRAAAAEAKWGFNLRIAGFFALHRVFRIYPLFWIVLAASVAINGHGDTLAAEPIRLLLTPPPSKIVVVAWTLGFEIYFYAAAAVALLLWARRFTWALILCAFVHVMLVATGMLHGALTFLVFYEFALGVAVAMLLEKGILAPPVWVLFASAIWFVGGAATFLFFRSSLGELLNWRLLLFGFPAALLVYGLVGVERRGLTLPVCLQQRGAESYSLYLWHVLVLQGVYWLWTPQSVLLSLVWVLVAIATTMVIAHLSFRIIERPFIRFAHRWY